MLGLNSEYTRSVDEGVFSPSFIAVRSISVETYKCFPDKAVGKRVVVCRYDGYACFRNLCCFSRFYSPFRCLRHVRVSHYLFTYPTVRPDLRSCSHG